MYRLEYYYINARTGERCNYNGDSLDDPLVEYDDSYSDLDSLSADLKEKVTTLKAYGISLAPVDGKFSKNSPVTEQQYLSLMSSATGNYYNSSFLQTNDLEKFSNSTKSLTNRNAAKIFVGLYGATTAANIKGIYKSPYTDVKESDPDVGFIAIMSGIGHLPESETFNPDGYMTREVVINQLYSIYS
jgi:hypothetical protein